MFGLITGSIILAVILSGIFYLKVINTFDCSNKRKLKTRIEYLESKNDMLVEFCKIKSSDDQAHYTYRLKEDFKNRLKGFLKNLRKKIN